MFNPAADFRVEAGHVIVMMAGAEGRAELETRIAALNA